MRWRWRRIRGAALREQRFHAALGNVGPIPLEWWRYLKPGSGAVMRKSGEGGSDKRPVRGQAVEKLPSRRRRERRRPGYASFREEILVKFGRSISVVRARMPTGCGFRPR